ncbi:MAG: hypothetical protein SF182_29605 [Deltaproteobacteria bacterium]|nr:hypothetical protein [Deltaproteobacteria bacterium]
MIRFACLLGLIALAAMAPMLAQLDGASATLFAFVGFPALGFALLVYGVARWRAGAFRVGGHDDFTRVRTRRW